MAYPTTQVCDCLIVSKKFERGVIFSSSQESTFAILSPMLDSMRIQSKNYINQADAVERLSTPIGAAESAFTAQDPQTIADTSASGTGGTTLAPNATALTSSPAASSTGSSTSAPNATALLGNESGSNIARNLDKADETEPSFGEKIAGNFGLLNEAGNFDMSGIFDSKCIPCNLRIDGAGLDVFFTNLGTGFLNGLSEYLNFYENLFWKQLQQLQDMLGMFDDTNPYMDMCAFIKFFTEFMCVPDIARIIATLMGLMKSMSFEMSSVFDLILQFIAPFMSALLGNLVSLVEQFIMMVIKPIECIIDSIQGMLAKLDYNILFQNIQSLDKTLDLGGPKKGARLPGNESNEARLRKEQPDFMFRLNQPRLSPDEPKLPWIDGQLPRRDIVEGERFAEFEFNMAGPLSTIIDAENARNQQAVEKSAEELASVRRVGRNIDGTDASAIARQREAERAAENNYRSSLEKRNMSYVGRANAAIERGVEGMKSSLMLIIGFLREGAQAIQGFFDYIFDEFKKLMGEYLGGSGGMIGIAVKKNQLSQIIDMVVSIYEALRKGAICEDDPDELKISALVPQQQNMNIWTDEQGDIHIEGDNEEVQRALEDYVSAYGQDPYAPTDKASPRNKFDDRSNLLPQRPDVGDIDPLGRVKKVPDLSKQKDRGIGKSRPIETGLRTQFPGGSPSDKDRGLQPSTTSRKLKSLIEFTGDPVLDSEIARITDRLTRTVNVVFKCPLNTSVTQSEQINQWIKEINS